MSYSDGVTVHPDEEGKVAFQFKGR
jgi:hypothetical protein